ncbi:peroxiredoxin [Thiocapsa imhoffii]|uniref:thioredoxin-dependent peroxiredoxin n=1 Tax=Thiocapsa imhoffii TaxID=382777 RepID=A0A9X0WJZ9_9GAMM|nr:peroxiredoxin [Thiocapsa imhoffii]MBK1645895.1 peroxiredoxin [Thiocapsa imhoffii]
MSVAIGEPIPDLELPVTGGKTVKLSDYRGQHLVLYFYPKASTPGCTQEGQDFRDAAAEFAAAHTQILGASRDGVKAQENFKTKQAFPFDLVSDTDEALCQAFDVIKLKKMYGKESLGVERSTFLIDAEGVLRAQWRGVKVKDHVAEVLSAARALATG